MSFEAQQKKASTANAPSLAWTEKPWFAFVTILLLQLKVLWGVWNYRGELLGDTYYYFESAQAWANGNLIGFSRSPLYVVYFGTIFQAVHDVRWTTVLHRMGIVFLIAILVLGILRKLLPAPIAWLVAAWWVVLPTNFDTLYEVHLFAIILPLVAVLIMCYRQDAWARGIVLAILLVQTILVRNEAVFAVGLWALGCLNWEVRQARSVVKYHRAVAVKAYVLPVFFVTLAIFAFTSQKKINNDESLHQKQAQNFCQAYAFGYRQRHPEWAHSPWTQCKLLMMTEFGRATPTLLEAMQANPQAVLTHIKWNLYLTPAGLQLALFNSTSGSFNPDYIPVELENRTVILPTIALLAILIAGILQLTRNWSESWSSLIKERAWAWGLLICFVCITLVVIPTQRPRPAYMFMLSFFLMVFTGLCFYITAQKLGIYRQILRLVPALMIALPILAQPYYSQANKDLLKRGYINFAPYGELINLDSSAVVRSARAADVYLEFTRTGKLLDVDVLDHMVIGQGRWVSLKERGLGFV